MKTAELTMQDVLDALPIDFEGVTFSLPGWVDLNDRKTLYRAAIVALMEAAEDDGYEIVNEANALPVLANAVTVQTDSEKVQWEGEAACEDCTAMVEDAIGGRR